jgi:hypothetical protein
MNRGKCGTDRDIKALSAKRTEKYLANQIKQRVLVPKLGEHAIMQEAITCEKSLGSFYANTSSQALI